MTQNKVERFEIDGPAVTRDEALELMVYHLKMAAALYEATPKDDNAVLDEMERLMVDHSLPSREAPALLAARPWLARIRGVYADMKRADR